jgi:hypothetical protein
MDIYFCDLCGVRVTDADLRSGHGIRNRSDVLCATCLEMGHGKDWLSQRSQTKAEPVHAAVGNASFLDQARDRAQTLEDDELPASSVRPVEVDIRVGVPEELSDHVVTAKVPGPKRNGEHIDLSSAANLFSALSNAPVGAVKDGQGDDLQDQAADSYQIGGASTPFTPAIEKRSATAVSSDNDETSIGPAVPNAAREAAARNKTASRKSTSSHPAAKPSTRSAANKNKISSSLNRVRAKSGRQGKAKGGQLMILTIISVTILTAIFAYWFTHRATKVPKTTEIDFTGETKAKVKKAKETAVNAIRSKNVNDLQNARNMFQSVMKDIEAFEVEAKRQHKTDEEIERIVETTLQWQNAYMLLRNVNDELQKQK